MEQTTELMLQLLRASLNGSTPNLPPLPYSEWERIYWLSRKHGVVTMVFDAIERLPEEEKPHGDIALSWELSAERTRYHFAHQAQVLEAIKKKASEIGIPLILIKGMTLAKLYPRPDSRACGDIDIYFPNNYQKGNHLLGNPEAGLDGKHAEVVIDGVTVENHLHFLDLNYRSQRKAEQYIIGSLHQATPDGELCPMANMVYLLMHTVCHLTAKYKLPLRNVIDWGIFLRAHQSQLDPAECHRLMRKINMEPAFNALTYLASELVVTDISQYIQKEKLRMEDMTKLRDMILDQSFVPPVPKEFKRLKRIIARYKRNRQRRWLYRYLPSSASERLLLNLGGLFTRKTPSL